MKLFVAFWYYLLNITKYIATHWIPILIFLRTSAHLCTYAQMAGCSQKKGHMTGMGIQWTDSQYYNVCVWMNIHCHKLYWWFIMIIFSGIPCVNHTSANSNTSGVVGHYGDVIHVQCNKGYSLSQSGEDIYVSKCNLSGLWTHSENCTSKNFEILPWNVDLVITFLNLLNWYFEGHVTTCWSCCRVFVL